MDLLFSNQDLLQVIEEMCDVSELQVQCDVFLDEQVEDEESLQVDLTHEDRDADLTDPRQVFEAIYDKVRSKSSKVF